MESSSIAVACELWHQPNWNWGHVKSRVRGKSRAEKLLNNPALSGCSALALLVLLGGYFKLLLVPDPYKPGCSSGNGVGAGFSEMWGTHSDCCYRSWWCWVLLCLCLSSEPDQAPFQAIAQDLCCIASLILTAVMGMQGLSTELGSQPCLEPTWDRRVSAPQGAQEGSAGHPWAPSPPQQQSL